MGNARSTRRPGGVLLADGKEIADTKQCCHCGMHFIMVRGSGKRRGYCMNCGDITCGSQACSPCMHFMKKLELYEAGQLASPMAAPE